MKRYIQHEYLKVEHFTRTEWHHPVHNHNHFEIIFIHSGKGMHCLSGMEYPYEGRSMFLLAPCDYHRFNIEEETTFTFLKFTNVYLNGIGHVQLQRWNQGMDQLLLQARRQDLPLLSSEGEAVRMEALIKLIVEEWKETESESSETVFFLVQALISMLGKRETAIAGKAEKQFSEKISALIHYIHQHIYNPDEVQIERLAAAFAYSKNYLGIFFREQTGMALKDYISRYKLHLVENRLRYSSLSLKEISNELGFSDLSHFNKFFRRYHELSPSAYRENAPKSQIDRSKS